MTYSVSVNLDSSGLDSFVFIANAESYFGAMISALAALDKSHIDESQIDSLTISLNAFMK